MKKRLFGANLLRYMWIVAVIVCTIMIFVSFIVILKLSNELVLYTIPIVGIFGFLAITLALIYINKYNAPIHVKPDNYTIRHAIQKRTK